MMIYTALLADRMGRTKVFTFHGSKTKSEAYIDFRKAIPFTGFDGFRLLAIVPGEHEVTCWDITHTLPRDVTDTATDFMSED